MIVSNSIQLSPQNIFTNDNTEFTEFTGKVEHIISEVDGYAKEDDIAGLNKLITNFRIKTEDFYRENRQLNIGVIGQVKAGKSSFLNTLLFEGKEILPKASTPKTATLTKMEYSEKNIIQIEYYSTDEWGILEDNAVVDLDDEIYTAIYTYNNVKELIYVQQKLSDTTVSGLDSENDYKKTEVINGSKTIVMKKADCYTLFWVEGNCSYTVVGNCSMTLLKKYIESIK